MNLEQIKKKIEDESFLLIGLLAEWAGPAVAFKPKLAQLENKYNVLTLNTDQCQEFCAEMQVSGVPTVLVFKNKKLVLKIEGNESLDFIVEQVEKRRI